MCALCVVTTPEYLLPAGPVKLLFVTVRSTIRVSMLQSYHFRLPFFPFFFFFFFPLFPLRPPPLLRVAAATAAVAYAARVAHRSRVFRSPSNDEVRWRPDGKRDLECAAIKIYKKVLGYSSKVHCCCLQSYYDQSMTTTSTSAVPSMQSLNVVASTILGGS